MALHRERRWPLIAAGYAVLLAVVAAVAAFIHDGAAAADRPTVIRLAVAFMLGVAILHLRVYFRGDPRWEPPSDFEEALAPRAVVPKLDAGFVRLREQVENAVASQRYFERAVWPRLQKLARAQRPDGGLELPPSRGWLGRGPSRRAIADLLDRIEGGR